MEQHIPTHLLILQHIAGHRGGVLSDAVSKPVSLRACVVPLHLLQDVVPPKSSHSQCQHASWCPPHTGLPDASFCLRPVDSPVWEKSFKKNPSKTHINMRVLFVARFNPWWLPPHV